MLNSDVGNITKDRVYKQVPYNRVGGKFIYHYGAVIRCMRDVFVTMNYKVIRNYRRTSVVDRYTEQG